MNIQDKFSNFVDDINVSCGNCKKSISESLSSMKKWANEVKKTAEYQFSLAFTMVRTRLDSKRFWWNKIQGTNIILGGIPLKDRGHDISILKDAGNDAKKLAVLTLLEPFEYETNSFFAEPVKPANWSEMNVKQKIIETTDFKPLPLATIQKAVRFLEKQEEADKITYVHCKAGVGRSATAVICFLIKKGMPAEAAKKAASACRPQINLSDKQWEAIKDYELSLRAIEWK